MVLGAYRQVVGWRDDLKTLTADEPAIAKAMAESQGEPSSPGEAICYVDLHDRMRIREKFLIPVFILL